MIIPEDGMKYIIGLCLKSQPEFHVMRRKYASCMNDPGAFAAQEKK